MKPQEVIDILKMFTTDKFQRCTSSEFDDAIYVAIKALEKQIPKKPVDNPENGWFECPNCGQIVWVYYGSGEKHHCECGQALEFDWEVIE